MDVKNEDDDVDLARQYLNVRVLQEVIKEMKKGKAENDLRTQTIQEEAIIIRHCATCLQVCEPPIKTCSGCKKRAYCSKECQIADWKVTGNGQRHKNWCGRYDYGEEDVDWEVVPVPKKGLGIRAKRFIPTGYRIIIERIFTDPNGHPGINDLEPKAASLEAKFKKNSIIEGDDEDFLGLRISRVNHNCRPNAECSYDKVAQVAILYALRDIRSGEEICRSYINFDKLALDSFDSGIIPPDIQFSMMYGSSLITQWGIACPINCFCKNTDARKLMVEARHLGDKMKSRLQTGSQEGVLEAGEKRLEIQRRLNISWSEIARLECELYHISIMKKKTLPKADALIKDVLRIYKIIQPYSKLIEKYEKLSKYPESDENYLKLEKK